MMQQTRKSVLCNHQGVSKAHDAQMEKLQDKKKIIAKEIAALAESKGHEQGQDKNTEGTIIEA